MVSKGLKVLLLEVDPASAARLSGLASGGGRADGLAEPGVGEHTVEVAADLTGAVAQLHTEAFDAVLVGVDAARGDGVLPRLRAAAPDVAVVLLRAGGDDRVPLEPQDVGIQSTLDVWSLDQRALALTLHLAVERHRLALAQQQAALQAEAMSRMGPARDPLTGLPCGERLLEEIDLFLADAIRFNRPFTVAVVGVDGLAGTRVAEGMAVADSILIHVAGVMDQCLRTSDLLGRLDEDVMLIAMPGTSTQAAGLAARRIRERLDSLACTVGREERSVTVSIGMASLNGLMAVDELVFQAHSDLAKVMA